MLRVQPFNTFRAFGFLNRSFASFSQTEIEKAVVSQVQSIDGVDISKSMLRLSLRTSDLTRLPQIEMYSYLEEKFGVTLGDDDIDGVKGVPDLVKILVSKLN